MNRIRNLHRLQNSHSGAKSFLTGNLLVASPVLQNIPAAHAVVLILEHSPAGATGVVLNSQANEAAQRWCQNLASMSDKQQALQQLQQVAESQMAAGEEGQTLTFCLAKPAHSMEEIVEQLGSGIRILVGSVTWEAGKLEQELAAGAWLFCPGFPALLFGEHEDLWQASLQCIGEAVIASAPGVSLSQNAEWN